MYVSIIARVVESGGWQSPCETVLYAHSRPIERWEADQGYVQIDPGDRPVVHNAISLKLAPSAPLALVASRVITQTFRGVRQRVRGWCASQ